MAYLWTQTRKQTACQLLNWMWNFIKVSSLTISHIVQIVKILHDREDSFTGGWVPGLNPHDLVIMEMAQGLHWEDWRLSLDCYIYAGSKWNQSLGGRRWTKNRFSKLLMSVLGFFSREKKINKCKKQMSRCNRIVTPSFVHVRIETENAWDIFMIRGLPKKLGATWLCRIE